MKLSPREMQCLDFIAGRITATGHPPFQFEIAEHFGTKSRGFVWRVLKSLEAKGAICIKLKSPRGIEIVGRQERLAA